MSSGCFVIEKEEGEFKGKIFLTALSEIIITNKEMRLQSGLVKSQNKIKKSLYL
jgi:hypothetical protein